MSLSIGSLFAGIGGLEKGLEMAGLGPVVFQVEISPFCRSVLARHWPDAVRYEDVKTASGLPPVDVICGGFPCQDVSVAGKGAGMEGARSGLWREFARIVGELRPRFVVVENVASGKSRWLPTVRRDLHLLGYDSTAYAISAADVGAPHLRRRILVVAHGHGHGLRLGSERVSGRWAGELRREGCAESIDAGAGMADADEARLQRPDIGEPDIGEPTRCSPVLANGNGNGREREPAARLHADGAPGHDAIGRHRFPPRRGDAAGWADWTANGGPQPGIRRDADGVPSRLDRALRRDRLRALGNAVVPQCSEVVGRIVAEMAGVSWRWR